MNKLVRNIVLGSALVILAVVAWLVFGSRPNVGATQVEACGNETTYVDDNTDDHSRVNVNFNDYQGDDDREVVITPKAGYRLTFIGIDYTGSDANEVTPSVGDGFSQVTYQAPNNESIDNVTTKLVKVCEQVCNDDSATNYQSLVPGQTEANNELCEYRVYCEDENALNYKEEGECEYPEPSEAPKQLCEDSTALNFQSEGTCRYAGPASAPQAPTCEAPKFAPTVTYLGQNGHDFTYSWTMVKDGLHTYWIDYGATPDNLPYSVVVNGEQFTMTMEGNTNWMKVAGYSNGCLGPFSEITN